MLGQTLKHVVRGLALSGMIALAAPISAQSPPSPLTAYCGAADYSHDNSRDVAQEVLCLRTLAQSASRRGNTLTLRIENGGIKTYRSNPEACRNDDAKACHIYRLIGFHAPAHLFLILASYYEGIDCFLVSARDGSVTKLPDVPHFAPDGSTFMILDERGFAIGSVANAPPSLTWTEWTNPNDSLTWQFVRWTNMNHIALRTDAQFAGCPHGNCEAALVHERDAWKIQYKPAR